MQRDQKKQPKGQHKDFPAQGDDSIFYWNQETEGHSLIFHKDQILISRDILQRKYFEAFNFYFSKPINEILANLSLPHVIMYKDYLYYDDESEYLKRYYRLDETAPRLQNLSKFYSNTSEGLTKPNLAVHEQNKIILKRNNKLHKYYLSKLQNFADIPQTQRNNKPKDDFKVLNNLHDDDGYSEDLYRHQEHQDEKVDEKFDRQHGGAAELHNSFQQMLEQYENATAKVSFESVEHNVYYPEYSTDSPNPEKSIEDNISFEQSIEFFAKGMGLNIRHVDRPQEKGSYGDVEDQIPHNVSDFALSDASEIHLINEIMKNSRDEILSQRLSPNSSKDLRGNIERFKASNKQKENTEIDKEKEKYKAITSSIQKINASKSKSTSTTHIINKQSESHVKTAKTSIEKSRTPKESDNTQSQGYQEFSVDKTPKSLEKNIIKENFSEKPTLQQYAGSRKERDELMFDKAHISAKYLESYERTSPRDLQYPIISVKNLHIHQGKPTDVSKEQQLDSKTNIAPYDDKNFFNKNRKSAPQANKKIAGAYKKLSMPGEPKLNNEKASPTTSSGQYIKGLIEKYQRHPEENPNNKSKGISDKVKDISGSKARGNLDDLSEKYQRMGEIYTNMDLYSRVAQKADSNVYHPLSRSKTEDALFKEPNQNKSKRIGKESPTKTIDTQPSSGRRVVLSPTNSRKEKVVHRFGSNEGLSPRLVVSTTHKLTTQLSSENSKSHTENNMEDKTSSTGISNYKSVKVEKVFSYKRTEMKPPMKTSLQKNEASNSNTSNTRRLTAAHTGSGASSVEKNDLFSSVPVSPTKKFDLKLNLHKLNQLPGRYQHEASTENSYGFWSSRSAKLPVEEEPKHSKQNGGGITEDRNKYNISKKEYLLKKNYDPYLESKKKGKYLNQAGSFTNPIYSQGFKVRETEVSRSPVLLKSAAHETDLQQIYIQDLHEINSAGRVAALRISEPTLDVNPLKSDRRIQSKK